MIVCMCRELFSRLHLCFECSRASGMRERINQLSLTVPQLDVSHLVQNRQRMVVSFLMMAPQIDWSDLNP